MNIEQALKFFALDIATVNEEKVMAAFRAAARRFHPDSYKNYKAKVASVERFNAAIEARNLLRQSLESGDIPRTRTIQLASDAEPAPTEKKTWRPNPFIRDARAFHDSVSQPPFQRAMEHPILGVVLGIPATLSLMVAVMAGTIAAFPILSVGFIVAVLAGERFRKWFRSKADNLSGYATGLALFPFYFALTAAGVFIWADGLEEYVFPLGVVIVWFGLTLLMFDEIYSLLRYHLVLKKRASRALSMLEID